MGGFQGAVAIGYKFYQLRMELGLSQKQLAEKLGVGVSDVGSWEKGNPPSGDRLASVAELFEVSVNELTVGE